MLINLLAPYWLYQTLSLVCIIGAALCAIFVVIVVFIQPGNSNGISALGSTAETYHNKEKGQTLESKLRRLTYICLGIMAVLMIGFFVLQLPGILL